MGPWPQDNKQAWFGNPFVFENIQSILKGLVWLARVQMNYKLLARMGMGWRKNCKQSGNQACGPVQARMDIG